VQLHVRLCKKRKRRPMLVKMNKFEQRLDDTIFISRNKGDAR